MLNPAPGHRAVAALLLTLMLVPPGSQAQSTPNSHTSDKLDADQRILHVLNRFTFGAAPGDIAAVQKIGIDP